MSDDIKKPKEESPTIIFTEDRKKAYALAVVQNLFIYSVDPIEKFARRYGLSPTLIESYAKSQRWDELRAEHTKAALQLFKKADMATTEDALDVCLKFQNMRNAQLEQQYEEYAKYFTTHGHWFMVDQRTGEIMKDHSGFPIPLKFPQISEGLKEFISKMRKELKEMADEQQKLDEQLASDNAREVKEVDPLEGFRHLLKPKKDGN